MLLISPSAKELALKVKVDDTLLIDLISNCIRHLLVEKDETEGVKDLTNDSCSELLKLLSKWVADDKMSATYFLSLPPNLLFFEPLPVHVEKVQCLGAFLAACCLVSTWDTKEKSVAFGLIENKMGISKFFRFLSRLKEIINSNLGIKCDWSNDECTHALFDASSIAFVTKTVNQASPLLVKGSSSGPSLNQLTQGGITTGTEFGGINNGSHLEHELPNDSEITIKLKKLEQDYAQLLIVLAHQEIDRQSLLQTIEEIGGKHALDKALARSAQLLKTALSAYDTKQ